MEESSGPRQYMIGDEDLQVLRANKTEEGKWQYERVKDGVSYPPRQTLNKDEVSNSQQRPQMDRVESLPVANFVGENFIIPPLSPSALPSPSSGSRIPVYIEGKFQISPRRQLPWAQNNDHMSPQQSLHDTSNNEVTALLRAQISEEAMVNRNLLPSTSTPTSLSKTTTLDPRISNSVSPSLALSGGMNTFTMGSTPLSRAVRSYEASEVALRGVKQAIIDLAAQGQQTLPATWSGASRPSGAFIHAPARQAPSQHPPQPQGQPQRRSTRRGSRGKKGKKNSLPPPPTKEEKKERRLARNVRKAANRREKRLVDEAAGIVPMPKQRVKQQRLSDVLSVLHGTAANTIPLAYNRLARQNSDAGTGGPLQPSPVAVKHEEEIEESVVSWNAKTEEDLNNSWLVSAFNNSFQQPVTAYDQAWQVTYDSDLPAHGLQTVYTPGYSHQQAFMANTTSGFDQPTQEYLPQQHAPLTISLTPSFNSYPQMPMHAQCSSKLSQYALVGPQFISGGMEWDQNGTIHCEPASNDRNIPSVNPSPDNKPIQDLINTYADLPASSNDHSRLQSEHEKLAAIEEEDLKEGEVRECSNQCPSCRDDDASMPDINDMEASCISGHTRSHGQPRFVEMPVQPDSISTAPVFHFESTSLAPKQTTEEDYGPKLIGSHQQPSSIENTAPMEPKNANPVFNFDRTPLASKQDIQPLSKIPKNQVKYKDGDIVGAAAPAIHRENKGRVMLLKLGWQEGKGLGASPNKGILEPYAPVIKTTKSGLR